MSGAVGTEQSEDLQSLYNAVLQGFADETPADNASQRTIASPASSRRPLPAPPRVAQSVYDSIPPPPPMPAGNKRYAMPEPAHGYTAPSTTMTSQNGQNGFRRGPSFRPPGAGASRIPGSNDILDSPVPASPPPPPRATSSSSTSSSPYFPNDIKQSQLYSSHHSMNMPTPQPAPANSLAPPQSELRAVPSTDDILASGARGFVRRLSTESDGSRLVQGGGAGVDRNSSTSSSRTGTTGTGFLTRTQTSSTLASSRSPAVSTPDTSEFGYPIDYKARYTPPAPVPPVPPTQVSTPTSQQSHNNNNQHSPSVSISVSSPEAGSSGHRNNRLVDQIAHMKTLADPYEPPGSSYNGDLVGLDDEDNLSFDDLPSVSDDAAAFVNFALLSNIAVWLRDAVPRGTHVKGSIPYPRAFTGKDIVSALAGQVRRELSAIGAGSQGEREERWLALQLARSLQSQLFFYEVEWGGKALRDGVEDVYMFLDEGGDESAREELPTGVVTVLTRCYAPSCVDGSPCYSFACPRRARAGLAPPLPASGVVEVAEDGGERGADEREWAEQVDGEVLRSLPSSEVARQTIIHKLISKEAGYVRDLELIDTLFVRPIRYANPPVFGSQTALQSFLDDVFGALPPLLAANRRLLDMMNVRQREHSLVIKRIGDVLLEAATEFRTCYPRYVAALPWAEKRVKEECEKNHDLRLLLDQCLRAPEARRLDLKTFLNRPQEHLAKYELTIEAIAKETADGNPDLEYLREAGAAFKNLQVVCSLQAWQHAMGRGPQGKLEWHNLMNDEARAKIEKKEQKRQSIIFELIKGEMQYVRDLENMDKMYVRPLLEADPPIIPRDKVDGFVRKVFNNFLQLHAHHRRLLERLHAIQADEHPVIHSVTAAVFDAALNWREAYMEYITNYPKAEYAIVSEMASNPAFQDFVQQCTRHPDANRLDMKNFVNRPIPRLARYELLLKGIAEASPEGHEDRESIPHVIEVIKALLKETQPGVASAEQKVELWKYNANLVFKQGEYVDLDLLDDNRSLIHAGKLLRQPDTGFDRYGWSELFVLLFDNYLVMTKPKERDGITKYHVTRHPIPLELLTVTNFTDPPTQRGAGLLRFGKSGGGSLGGAHPADSPGLPTPGSGPSPDAASDSRVVYPCTIHHTGRLGGLYVLYAESASARGEWKEKLAEAQGLRKVVQEANKVFEVETLSIDTFLVPSFVGAATGANSPWNADGQVTGQVTCSVPFTTADGRALVAVGCAEGVWIGFRHDARSMRRVLSLKMVTQCAMLEEFGIFLVLADKSLFAYHIEALVPSSPHLANTAQTAQKLNGNKDVHFFSVGKLGERTLVIYMKKKGMDSIFRVLEPVVDKINERAKQPVSFGSRLGFRQARSDWFRVYKDFFLPSESYDLIFLKARIAVLCTKGFEIMDLTDFKSVTIPQRDDAKHEKLAKRCDSCRPMGMFRTSENEFLLCYDEFGLFVNRHGDPSRDKALIEWEGTAERVAWHPPYVLIFDSRFIEVRTVETGRLVQIIQGEDVRAIWDGRGTSQPPPAFPREGQQWTEVFGLETRIHGVMRAPLAEPNPAAGQLAPRKPLVAQHVFELVPTIPLYVPERLGSPTQQQGYGSGYHSGSPPASPRMSSVSGQWR